MLLTMSLFYFFEGGGIPENLNVIRNIYENFTLQQKGRVPGQHKLTGVLDMQMHANDNLCSRLRGRVTNQFVSVVLHTYSYIYMGSWYLNKYRIYFLPLVKSLRLSSILVFSFLAGITTMISLFIYYNTYLYKQANRNFI